MNITSEELLYAIKAAYTYTRDNPEDVMSYEETYEDVEASAKLLVGVIQGNVMAQRMNNKETNND